MIQVIWRANRYDFGLEVPGPAPAPLGQRRGGGAGPAHYAVCRPPADRSRPLPRLPRSLPVLLLSLALAGCASGPGAEPGRCVAEGRWVRPEGAKPVPARDLLARAAAAPAVLLGERHDSAAHHRWQLDTLAALHRLRPDLVLGLEMLPRRAQGALDRFAAGEVGEAEFLAAADWKKAWGYDANLYLPLLRFARDNRIPLVALNVDRDLVRQTSKGGWAAVPVAAREGVGDPAPPPPGYVARLADIFAAHGRGKDGTVDPQDPGFRRFVDAQLVWDRAMAEGIAAAHRRGGALVVGIMGGGHVEHGDGVAHQLRALGVAGSLGLLPWDGDRDCAELAPGLADAVYGLPPEGPAQH